jgi:hypothetical protein
MLNMIYGRPHGQMWLVLAFFIHDFDVTRKVIRNYGVFTATMVTRTRHLSVLHCIDWIVYILHILCSSTYSVCLCIYFLQKRVYFCTEKYIIITIIIIIIIITRIIIIVLCADRTGKWNFGSWPSLEIRPSLCMIHQLWDFHTMWHCIALVSAVVGPVSNLGPSTSYRPIILL